MAGEFAFATMDALRAMTLRAVDGLGEEQLLAIPAPFTNNILWNLGHVLFAQHRLVFGLAGLPISLPAEYEGYFGRGSSPTAWQAAPDVAALKEHLAAAGSLVRDVFERDAFAGFTPYTVSSAGLTLSTPAEALQFHCVHEGIHLGTIGALRRLLA